jgi:hypothetical protein
MEVNGQFHASVAFAGENNPFYSLYWWLGGAPEQSERYSNNNSVALIRDRTIPTERPPLVDDFSVKFWGWRGVAW